VYEKLMPTVHPSPEEQIPVHCKFRMHRTLARFNRSIVGIAFDLPSRPGTLWKALEVFKNHSINLTHVENKPCPLPPHTQTFYVHFEGSLSEKKTQSCLKELSDQAIGPIYRVSAPYVPWFPRNIADLDSFSKSTLDAGDQLQSDHPGFNDPVYRKRREEIAGLAREYAHGRPIPTVEYTAQEIATWQLVFDKLTSLYPKLSCKEHNEAIAELLANGLMGPRTIPQLQTLSDYVKQRTGFIFRPVTGLLSARDFLNALAFRVFFSTQYIRHHSVPMYTPEPDIVHELLGHAPMFLNPDFADFTQYIGLASLGASDSEIKRLATCYWFSVEFGLIREGDDLKAYGAGLLSSFGELQHSTGPQNSSFEIRKWNPFEAADSEYPITKMQPLYFAAESLKDAKQKMKEYCDSMDRPFACLYDQETLTVFTDVDVRVKPLGIRDFSESKHPEIGLEPVRFA
jgi:phenylalanine-4-hydroxylase